MVALVAATKGLILGYRADFSPKVQYLCCGGSSYIGLWHTPGSEYCSTNGIGWASVLGGGCTTYNETISLW